MKAMLRSLLPLVLAPITQAYYRLFPGLRILMYHRVYDFGCFEQLCVSPPRFEQQMAWLAENRTVISLQQGIEAIQTGAVDGDQVVITFDDGYLDNLQYALPILEKYQLPATIFITTHFTDQSLQHPRYPADGERLHMDWNEVIALSQHPLITIGSHTETHPRLGTLTEADCTDEIQHSGLRLAEQLQSPIDIIDFCYPSGDYRQRERDITEAAGYRAAVTVSPGVNRAGADLFQLKRTEVTEKDDASAFAAKMAGALDPIHKLLDWRRKKQFKQDALIQNTSIQEVQ